LAGVTVEQDRATADQLDGVMPFFASSASCVYMPRWVLRKAWTIQSIPTATRKSWMPYGKGVPGPHNIYDVIPDSKNNVFFTDFRQRHIGRIDAKTGEIKLYEIPTPNSAPRRGTMDAQDRLRFGEYRGDRIGMLDARTGQFREWPVAPRWSAPYDVISSRPRKYPAEKAAAPAPSGE
jgi:streptogramin lyase